MYFARMSAAAAARRASKQPTVRRQEAPRGTQRAGPTFLYERGLGIEKHDKMLWTSDVYLRRDFPYRYRHERSNATCRAAFCDRP